MERRPISPAPAEPWAPVRRPERRTRPHGAPLLPTHIRGELENPCNDLPLCPQGRD